MRVKGARLPGWRRGLPGLEGRATADWQTARTPSASPPPPAGASPALVPPVFHDLLTTLAFCSPSRLLPSRLPHQARQARPPPRRAAYALEDFGGRWSSMPRGHGRTVLAEGCRGERGAGAALVLHDGGTSRRSRRQPARCPGTGEVPGTGEGV